MKGTMNFYFSMEFGVDCIGFFFSGNFRHDALFFPATLLFSHTEDKKRARREHKMLKYFHAPSLVCGTYFKPLS